MGVNDAFPGGIATEYHGTDSEVGRLRTVLVHRPGAELRRVTPRRRCGLLLPALPWAERAQQEHDVFTAALRAAGVTVLYLTELLQDVLEYAPARSQAVEAAISDPRLGAELRDQLGEHLSGLGPEELARVLITGLARDEFRGGRGAVFALLGVWDFVIEPLPNLVFARDACVWIGDSVAVARRVLDAGFARTVLAVLTDSVPGNPVLAAGAGAGSASEPLDMLCTFAGPDTVVMRSAVAYSLVARTITQGADGLRLSHPRPFLEAVADAMGLDRLRVVETGPGPPGPGRPRSGTTRPTCSRSDRRRYFPTSATR
jgi:arginine deiminase